MVKEKLQKIQAVQKSRLTSYAIPALIGSALVVCLLYYIQTTRNNRAYVEIIQYYSFPIIGLSTAVYILFALHYKPNILLRSIGRYSLWIYLLHLPILKYLLTLPLHPLLLPLLCFALSLLGAVCIQETVKMFRTLGQKR